MKAYLLQDGGIELESPHESRIVQKNHPAYGALAKLYRQHYQADHGGVSLSAASPPQAPAVPLPAGWMIRPFGNALGLFRVGRESPVAVAGTQEELVGKIAGAGRDTVLNRLEKKIDRLNAHIRRSLAPPSKPRPAPEPAAAPRALPRAQPRAQPMVKPSEDLESVLDRLRRCSNGVPSMPLALSAGADDESDEDLFNEALRNLRRIVPPVWARDKEAVDAFST